MSVKSKSASITYHHTIRFPFLKKRREEKKDRQPDGQANARLTRFKLQAMGVWCSLAGYLLVPVPSSTAPHPMPSFFISSVENASPAILALCHLTHSAPLFIVFPSSSFIS
jgi:hypothetical protein